MTKKYMYIITGGTMVHVAPHFSLCAPAYGKVGTQIYNNLSSKYYNNKEYKPILITTKMAGEPNAEQQILQDFAGLEKIETNEDLSKFIDFLITQPTTRGIIMATAVCDWRPQFLTDYTGTINQFGKSEKRLDSFSSKTLDLTPDNKIISKIRKERKDIFLVGFKATAGKSRNETYAAGLKSLKTNSANLVLANDIHNKVNMIITPEEYPYYYFDRDDVIENLCEMIVDRSNLTFTRTHVLDEKLVSLQKLDEEGSIPKNFIPVLKFLIENGAYKPFLNKTTGHFGCKVFNKSYKTISSVRKKDHNKVFEEGVVPIYGLNADGTKIIAGGAKPSVGEHTQQKIYEELGDEVHSIVHFHCDVNPEIKNKLSLRGLIREQKPFECGSNECAINTSTGMKRITPDTFASVYACHLEGHGPNIAFHKDVGPKQVIKVIKDFWNLDQKSGGNLD